MLIENAQIWSGEHDSRAPAVFSGAVLIRDDRIVDVGADLANQVSGDVRRIDAQGAFLMPGLIEGHSHLSFLNTARGNALGEIPPEDHAIATVVQAGKLLDAGFTSACSGAAAKIRLDVAVRDAIDAGLVRGPRLLAASPEITVTGGLGDARLLHLDQQSFGLPVDGVEEMRRAVRLCIREGVDTVKLNISGDYGVSSALAEHTVMMDDEIAVAVEVAHAAGRRVAAHARASESVKRAVRHGVDIIYHCDFADEEALEQLESVKDKVFTGPAIGIVIKRIESLRDDPSPQAAVFLDRLQRVFEGSCKTYRAMRERGIRVVIGGDYGFSVNPIGRNATDLEYFVTHFGYSPEQALQAATLTGAQLMMRGHELGRIKAGFLADLLLVDGDPLSDVRVLQDASKIKLIIKGGVAQ